MVRAKFNVAEITRYGNSGGGKIVLRPVTGGSDENKMFWKYTPSGTIDMYIDNEDALKQFTFGEYYVDFTKSE